MASSGKDGAGPAKRSDDGDRSNTSILSKKKKHFTNKRVSFAEALDVRTYNTEAVEDYYGGGLSTADETRPSTTDARARLAFDDEGEDTAPLGGPPNSTGLNPADSMDLYNHSPDVTLNADTLNFGSPSDMRPSNPSLRMSGNFNFDDDEQAYEPRFSIMHQEEPLNNVDDDDDDASVFQSGSRLSVHSKLSSEPRPPSALRPSLPEKRQLFSGDDDTIHFDAPPPVSSAKPPTALPRSSTRTPVRSEKRTRIGDLTPSSVLGRRIQEAALLRSSGKSASNATPAVTVEHSILEEPSDVTSKFPVVDKFLQLAEVKQAGKVLAKTETEEDVPKPDFDLTKLEGRITAGVMKECVYDRLNSSCSEMKTKVKNLSDEIKTLSIGMENSAPQVISRYTTDGQMDIAEKASVKSGLSRLKRCIGMKAKKEWYEYQIGIERDMVESLKQMNENMEKETKTMREMADRMAALRQRLEEELKDANLPGDDAWVKSTSEPADSQLTTELRNNMRERYALSRTRNEENNKEEVIREKMAEVDEGVRKLEEECQESRKRIEEGPVVTIQHRNRQVQKRRDLFASLTGIRTRCVKASKVVFCIANLADLTVSMDGDLITDLNIEYLPLGDGVLEPIKNFLEDAVMLANSCIVNVTKLEHLRVVLFLMAIHLESVKRAGLAVCNYIDAHGLDFDDVEVEEDTEYSQLRLNPSFFSSSLGTKFEAIVALKFYPPMYDGAKGKWELPQKEIEVCEVQSIIGTAPSLELVNQLVQEEEGDICDKLKKVWAVLQKNQLHERTPMEIAT